MGIENAILKHIEQHPTDLSAYKDLFDLAKETHDYGLNDRARQLLANNCFDEELWRKSLCFSAYVNFDAYCRYLELNRSNKFYYPRRTQLRKVVQGLQELEDGEISTLCISMPP